MGGVELFREYRRVMDNKWYRIGEEVSLDGVPVGILMSIGEFNDDVKISIKLYKERILEGFGEFYSLNDLD